MIDIICYVKHGQNFTPNSLIYRWAKETNVHYDTTKYFTSYITINGLNYTYHHMVIKPDEYLDKVIITLSLM